MFLFINNLFLSDTFSSLKFYFIIVLTVMNKCCIKTTLNKAPQNAKNKISSKKNNIQKLGQVREENIW